MTPMDELEVFKNLLRFTMKKNQQPLARIYDLVGPNYNFKLRLIIFSKRVVTVKNPLTYATRKVYQIKRLQQHLQPNTHSIN